MALPEKIDSDASSNDSNNGLGTKYFPLTSVDEPTTPDISKRTRESAFDTESFDTFYKPIESYEGYHRWDPEFQWDDKEEKKLVRKVCCGLCANTSSFPLC
jgi:hypothetical protein